ncbi:unnamed protein product [Zymoseptoria tritici ST99CH_1E4]|uniref:Dol-P-Man:Man(5)GlcNAc(2)-PP-Dol alpha-1,3-mannosyltransferase n=1 Tax=Zymoseptoria tritici ST99CH_1E4 TaxID=1276532 RepID=A0A2H1GYU6_ZYMTR|nr:unnamed protein product [Zymoseptoria tritici ST99CH_1E4]
MALFRQAWSLVTDPKSTKWTAPLQLLADAVLCGAVILKIPYTEIDWSTYMQQIELYLSGQRDYAKITGDTGPLVYPAAHVYIYRFLYYLTSNGTDIFAAQCIFAGLYLATLWIVMQCYRAANVPPYIFPLLSLSKRMHSIFVLRLFNDCWAVFFLFAAIWCWQRKLWTFGTLMYSVGLGVKMSLLLPLPAIGVVLWQGMGRDRAFYQAQSIGQVQTLIAYPFIWGGIWSYITRAFDFSRQFLYVWTVNWRFVSEATFLSKPFSYGLLILHVFLLHLLGVGRWLRPAGVSLGGAIEQLISPPSKDELRRIAARVTPDFTLTAILTSLIIGCLCARSLHYQFFVYIAWSVPFLLWRSGMSVVMIYAICFAQEWAWNVYPSTNASSAVVVGSLAVTVFSIWIGTSYYVNPPKEAQKVAAEHTKAE